MSRTGGGYSSKQSDSQDEGKTSQPSSPSSKEAETEDNAASAGGKTMEITETTDDNEGKTNQSSTGGTNEEQAPIIIEAGGRKGGPNLVQRFVDYVFRVIHTEMDDFFTRNAELFDQDWDDFNQKGETLEQHAVFKRYEELLDEKLSNFAEKENYDSAIDCFQELERLVNDDAEEHKKRMEEMQEQLRKAQEQQQAATEGASGKTSEGENTTVAKKQQPLMIFFQPISLEQLMQMVRETLTFFFLWMVLK